jgi:hypothetical protein
MSCSDDGLKESYFTVSFDREIVGRVSYADEEGYMSFRFERGPDKQVFLHPGPMIDDKAVSAPLVYGARYALALERTKDFLVGRGFDVAIDER